MCRAPAPRGERCSDSFLLSPGPHPRGARARRSGLASSRADLALWQELEAHSQPIAYGYFLEPGIASVLANGPRDLASRWGLVGRDRMIILPLVFGTDRSPDETVM